MLPIWKKRLETINLIYRDLLTPLGQDKLIEEANKLGFEPWQLEVIKMYLAKKEEVKEIVVPLLPENWFWKRLSIFDKAVIYQSYCEFYTKEIDKAIIINEALKNIEKNANPESKPYINAILDKILKR